MARFSESDLRAVGGLGMLVFFSSALIWSDFEEAPSWLVWPAFTVMLVATGGSLLLRLVRRLRR